MNNKNKQKLQMKDNLIFQSLNSVPKTYIRTTNLNELIPLSQTGRLSSLPSISSPNSQYLFSSSFNNNQQQQQSLTLINNNNSFNSNPLNYSPLNSKKIIISKSPPPRPIPQSLTKSFSKRNINRMKNEKNLDEIAPLNELNKLQPGNGICAKFVLCLLLNAIFVLVLFLIFLIGHFVSEAHLPLNNKNIEKNKQTIKDIYPPQFDEDISENNEYIGSISSLQFIDNIVHYHSKTTTLINNNNPIIPLPKIVLPKHYNIELDLTEFYGIVDWPRIRGNMSILLESFGNSTDEEIIFHSGTNIFIQRIKLYYQTEKGKINVEIKSVKRQLEKEFIRLILKQRLNIGWYWLYIEFNTRICQLENELSTYCFPNKLNNSFITSSSKRQLINGFSTKFQPNFAKTFFPCFDEISIRSTFNLTVLHFNDTLILFNTKSINKKELLINNQLIIITNYEITPPMPLYLFSIVILPFNKPNIQVKTTKTNITLNIWSITSQDILTSQFIANFSPIMFDKLQEDFSVKYPLSKMDIFLTPKYPVGGMENWGLIILHSETVRLSIGDNTLPINEDSKEEEKEGEEEEEEYKIKNNKRQNLLAIDKLAEKYRIEKIITHELIHQWFGNLVSIYDWEELWLSEGFTSYFVFDFLNSNNYPQLTEHEYYLKLIELINKQSINTGKSSLINKIQNSNQLNKLFDNIQLYTKGAVIVKMIKDLVGPIIFKNSITRFLKENAFQSVDRNFLWNIFPLNVQNHGADDNIKLKEVIESWLINKGMPEIEIKRNYEDKSIKLKQIQTDKNKHLIYLNNNLLIKKIKKREENEEINGILNWIINDLDEKEEKQNNNKTEFKKINLKKRKRKQNNKKINNIFSENIILNNNINNNIYLINSYNKLKRSEQKQQQNNNLLLWLIPFSYSFGSIKSKNGQIFRQFWLINETIRFIDIGLEKENYLLGNPHWIYPYRVNYDFLNWKLIIKQLHKNYQEIPPMSRIQLIVDSEYFLRESLQPHLFVYLLSYLSKENELGVLLVGLDALHSFLKLFSATEIFGSLIVHLLPVILHLDKQLLISTSEGTDPELAALWLLNPLRLSKLYQLRCSANLNTLLSSDNYQQLISICYHLFKYSNYSELSLLFNLIKQPQSKPLHSIIRQLASNCVQDEKLINQSVLDIINSRNVIIYSNSLKNEYTLNYNKKFREIFWTELSKQLNINERKILFAVNTGKSDYMARNLLHSIHSLGELNLIEKIILNQWPDNLRIEMDYLRRKLSWIESEGNEQIRKYLIRKEFNKDI